MDVRTTYACKPCGATSDVIATDLWAGPPDATPETAAGILKLRAERELLWATCPRCGARNPEGVSDQKKRNREWRIGFTLFSAALAAGIWFFPPLRWLLVFIMTVMTAVILYALRRVGGSAGAVRSAVFTVIFFVVVVVVSLLYPRWAALYPFVMVFQFARSKEKPDEAWERAKARLRFAEPYR